MIVYGRSRIKGQGFTLVELMIVLVVVAIIAAIAIPSYANMVRKARRADAVDSLLLVQSMQEKWRVSNSTFGELDEIGFDNDGVDDNSRESNEGHYTIRLRPTGSPTLTATTFIVGAAATGDQADDSDCATMLIQVNALNPRGNKRSFDSDNNETFDCW